MAIQLGSAYGKVNLDVAGLLNGVLKGKAGLMMLANAGQKIGASMKQAGQAMTLGLTLPIAALGVASIKAASDLEETRNKVKVVFGDMSEDVLKWSQDSARAFGLSRQQALEAAGTFGNLFTSMGLGTVPAADMSEGLVQLAADLASFNNIDPSLVLEKLRSGLVGEVEPLRTLGINLTMAATKAKAMEMGLVDANGEVTQAGLLQARYALILEQSTNAQGDFARTSDGLANSTRIMNAEWKDALATLGTNLLPIALAVVHALNRMLEAFNNMSPFQQKAILGFLGLVAVMGPVLVILGTLLSTISSIAGFIGLLGELGITIGGLGAGLSAAVPAAVALGAALLPILIIIGAIGLYVGILYLMWKTNFMGMRDNVATMVKVVKSLWAALLAFLRGDTEAAMEHLTEAFNTFKERLAVIFGNFAGFAQNWSNFLNWIRNALSGVVSYISKSFSNINWSTIGKYILYGLANGMLLGLPSLLVAAAHIAEQLLAQIKKSLGIASDSKQAIKLGYFTGHGFATGLQMGANPEAMARSLARPFTQNSSSQQQTINMNIAGGVTMKEVRGLIAANNEELMNTIAGALNG
jgi:hypothetical protein